MSLNGHKTFNSPNPVYIIDSTLILINVLLVLLDNSTNGESKKDGVYGTEEDEIERQNNCLS